MVHEQPGRRLQPLSEVDDFLLWDLANDSARIPIKDLHHNSIKVRVNRKLNSGISHLEYLTHSSERLVEFLLIDLTP